MQANHSATLNTLFDSDGSTATLITAVPVGRALAEHLEPSLLTEAEDHTNRAITTAIGPRPLCSPCSPTSV